MIPTNIHAITLADLTALIGVARESKTLEFKKNLPAGAAGDLKVLKGVTGMANAAGGDFIIGVSEAGGAATAVDGIATDDPDRFKVRLLQVIASNVEPPLPPLDVQEVDCGGGRWAFVFRVGRSWIGPHRVTKDNHFYVRTSGATVPLGVDELRAAFGLRDAGADRIEAFRRERLMKFVTDETPVRLQDGPIAVLHMAPLPSFANRDLIDVVTLVANGTEMPMTLRGAGTSGNPQANLLGFINASPDLGQGSPGYGQLFRTGAFEAVAVSSIDNGQHFFGSISFANMIVGAVRQHLRVQKAYGIAFPTYAMVSLCKAADLVMRMPSDFGGGYFNSPPLREELVAFPELLIESETADVPAVIRPLLNVVWNAFGYPACTMYTPDGRWTGTG